MLKKINNNFSLFRKIHKFFSLIYIFELHQLLLRRVIYNPSSCFYNFNHIRILSLQKFAILQHEFRNFLLFFFLISPLKPFKNQQNSINCSNQIRLFQKSPTIPLHSILFYNQRMLGHI